MEQPSRRSKRARVAVDYARLDTTGFSDCMRVEHRRLTRAVLKFEEQPSVANYFIDYVGAHYLTNHVHSTGFRNPCVVRASDEPPAALGIRLPEGELTVDRIANLIGVDRHISTIDVATQSEGPIYTLAEWVGYFASPSPRKPLLNVVSLDLANTALQELVTAPSIVKELDLVDRAWPPSHFPSPQVQLYTLMSVAGCFMDFHIDFGGSSVWYHVLSGRKVFLVVPPTPGNLMAFEEWASSDRQASVFFAERVSGCQKLELATGDTLFLPGGWPHCVVTPLDSIVIGGNFLTGYNMALQLDIWQMEERLKVRPKFRFPLYKELMWHTASHYLGLLIEDAKAACCKVTKWERDGILSLAKFLSQCLSQVRDGEQRAKQTNEPTRALLEELNKYLKLQPAPPLGSTGSHLYMVEPPVQLVDDHDDDFDPLEENEDDDDDDKDFILNDSVYQRQTKVTKQRDHTFVHLSCTKPVVSSSPPGGDLQREVTKRTSSVRSRLLKKCGFDPRFSSNNLKFKPKQQGNSKPD